MESFRTNLEEFASKHREEIRKNPQFRNQFQEMCATIGVDPLACMSVHKELLINILKMMNFSFHLVYWYMQNVDIFVVS
jgi:hypothetical protein